jgi:hypothetical protein
MNPFSFLTAIPPPLEQSRLEHKRSGQIESADAVPVI